tara:strand:+ start:77974 stop:79026 length:1053 start_codon:yes stop_codon:yes gene_type:complete
MDLDKLFNEENPKCEGCPILKKPLPRRTILDYEFEEPKEILFVSDAPKMHEGSYTAFRPNEYRAIMLELRRLGISRDRVGFTTAMKCPGMTMDTSDPVSRKKCMAHLEDTIAQFKPTLVFACGKLATTIFYGKNKKDTTVRGKAKEMQLEDGFTFSLVSVMHPWQVVSEPKNAYLFSKDVENAVNSTIHDKDVLVPIEFDIIQSEEDIKKHVDFYTTKAPIAVDVETEGLNFLEHRLHTISFSMLDLDEFKRGNIIVARTVAMPIDHREAKFSYKTKAKIMEFVSLVLANANNRKIFQHATFDLKFLLRYGVSDVKHVWDTKLMQHLYLEGIPKGLRDLVYYYFPLDKIQ